MSSPNDPQGVWLRHKWLKLAWIFNLALGLEAEDPFDLPSEFKPVFRDIKAAIDRGDIASSAGLKGPATKGTKIRADGLGKVLSSQKFVPEVLTDFQHRWARIQGITPSQQGAPAKLGRPTNTAEIFAAYKKLKNDKCIDFTAPKNRLYEPIRRLVRQDTNVEKGLSDEAIRGAISSRFDEDARAAAALVEPPGNPHRKQ